MKIVLLQHLSGAKTYDIGEEIEVSDLEAVRMIQKGIAEAKTPKAHNDLMAKAEKLEKAEADKRAKLIAIQKEDELKGEVDALLEELVVIVTTIETLNKGYKKEFLALLESKLSKGK